MEIKLEKDLTLNKKRCILLFFVALTIKTKGGHTMVNKLYHKLEDDFNSFFWGNLELRVKDYVRDIIESGLDNEITQYVKAERYERFEGRKEYRNGYYERKLNTTLGKINLRIPRTRSGRFRSEIIPRYKRNTGRFDRAVLESFVHGISTRKMKRITDTFSGIGVSHGTVSNIFKEIDINRRQFQSRSLEDKYKYILLDGLWVNVYQNWHFKRVILVAMGITEDGVQEIIDFRVAKSESSMHWTNFLEDLRKRGLTGEKLKLIVHDDAKGINAAINMVYPFAQEQLCIHHRIMGMIKHIKNQKNKYEILKDCSNIYKQQSKKQILKKVKAFILKWTHREKKVVKNFLKDFELTLNYLNYPKEEQILIRTTSRLERANRYFRERTKYVGCFKGVKSVERFSYIVFHEYNKKKLNKRKPEDRK